MCHPVISDPYNINISACQAACGSTHTPASCLAISCLYNLYILHTMVDYTVCYPCPHLQVWPSRYRLICTRTNSTADALEDEGYYIIIPTLEYSLLKEGGGSVLEIKVVQTIE